jgi:peptidoglycan-N-acetylglucosamine deacetylase
MFRHVALTFDVEFPDRSGWHPDNLDRLLDTLAREGVLATFFLQGRWVRACPQSARRIVGEGHVVGNHSSSHCRYERLTAEGIRADVGEGEQAVRDITARDPRPWFRLPFGAGQNDARIRSVIEELSYQAVSWDVDARDWDPERTTDEVVEAVVRGVRSQTRAIVLMHSWPDSAARALPRLIPRLRELDGVQFRTMPGYCGSSADG